MKNFDSYLQANKSLWNKRTPVHAKSDFYDLASFRQGNTSLNAIELQELGNVEGKTLLHLQCHFGQDTLSWAREGAIVTGVDFSEESIMLAQSLATDLKLEARFICCNVYDTRQYVQEQFDVVFTSYGVLGWLPDLDKWAEVVAQSLKPGGTFYMIEFHPVIWMFDPDFIKVAYSYFYRPEPISDETEGTYADHLAEITNEEYSWNHGQAEVISALLNQGLQLEQFHEFPFSSYNCFKNLVKGEDGFWRIKGLEDMLPMMYSLKMRK